MKFLMNDQTYEVFIQAAEHLGAKLKISARRLVEIDGHEGLALIARGLGAEQMFDAVLESTLSEPSDHDKFARRVIKEIAMRTDDNMTDQAAKCEICGRPVKSARSKTCGDPECDAEKKRRYANAYYQRHKTATGGRATADPFEGPESAPTSEADV